MSYRVSKYKSTKINHKSHTRPIGLQYNEPQEGFKQNGLFLFSIYIKNRCHLRIEASSLTRSTYSHTGSVGERERERSHLWKKRHKPHSLSLSLRSNNQPPSFFLLLQSTHGEGLYSLWITNNKTHRHLYLEEYQKYLHPLENLSLSWKL